MKKVLLLVVVCLAATFANAQKSKEELQKEESALKKEITELTNQLTVYQSKKKGTLKEAAAIQRKIAAREQLVGNISRQVKAIDETIYQNELEIYRMKKELDTLKAKYAQSIVFAYKNRSSYQALNFLFSATSFNDALKRMTYLKSYRKLRETQVDNINKTQALLQEKMGSLAANKKEQTGALQAQQGQLQELEHDKKANDQVIKEIKGQEKEITAQLRKKEKQRQDMKNAIASIVKREIAAEKEREKERIRKAAEIEKARIAAEKIANASKPTPPTASTKPPSTLPIKPKANEPQTTGLAGGGSNRDYSPFESTREGVETSKKFEAKNLPWPVSAGAVTLNFGPFTVPNTHIKGNSDGIEISVPEGTQVRCVADGVVTSIFDMGGELAVTVRHGKYFTTYGHLSSASVSKGQEVKSGTTLGKAGTNDDNEGSLLFMVNNDKNVFLNPKNWLKAR